MSRIVFATFFASILVLAECSAGSVDSVSHRSARWDAYRASKRERRNTPDMEWQNTNQFQTCTLSDITTYDALGRRDSGLLARPQSQGICGSCWAFAATHVFTDYLSLSSGSAVAAFSPDHLTKCISPFGDRSQAVGNGCCGGNADDAFRFLQAMGAVPETCLPYTLSSYPSDNYLYKYLYPLECPVSCTNPALPFNAASNRIPGFARLQSEAQVISALDQGHPIFAAMEVRDDFVEYRCGVFCGAPINLPNHAVEIVDYSRPDFSGSPYWVVKNSWGQWGEAGYFRIARGQNQLTDYVTINESTMTQNGVPDETPSLTASTCNSQQPSDESDNELVESAVEFAIQQLNNRSEIRCADDNNMVATLSLSSVVNETLQIVEGILVEASIVVDIDGCRETSATITVIVMIDLDENFSLDAYNNYVVTQGSGGTENGGNKPAISAFNILLLICLLVTFV